MIAVKKNFIVLAINLHLDKCIKIIYSRVMCDNLNCKKEWFHLECVGLNEIPNENEKWICPNCSDNALIIYR